MKKFMVILFLIGSIFILFSFEPEFMVDPAISPDGSEVCFSYLNDLWVVSIDGGIAKRLSSTSGYDYNPEYSPDGSMIAFNSDRDGVNKIYIIPAKGGLAKAISQERLVFHDWFSDNKHILAGITSPGEYSQLVKVSIEDGKRPVIIAEYGDSFACVSPDDKSIIFNRRGDPYREAYKGSHNGDLFLYDIKKKVYSQLTDTQITERYPVFSHVENDIIYYCASDGKVFQIYKSNIANMSDKEQLTNFDLWSPRDLSISDNDTIVFELFNKICKLNTATKQVEEIKITIAEDFLDSSIVEETNHNKVKSFAISPNGKLVVFNYKYDLFAVPSAGGKVKQITNNQAGIEDIVIGQDNETILFTSYLKGDLKLFKTNINNLDKIEMIKWSQDKRIVSFSSFYDRIFIRYHQGDNRNRIAVMDSNYNKVEDLIKDHNVSSYTVSKDCEYVFYTVYDRQSKASNLYFLDIKKNESRHIHSQLSYISSISLDPANNYLFLSFESGIHKLSLNRFNEFENDEDKWDDILTTKSEKAEHKVAGEFNWQNLDNRFNKIVSADEGMWVYPLFATSDSTLYYMSYSRKNSIIKKISYNGKDDKEVFNANSKIDTFDFINGGKTLYYSTNGSIYNTQLPGSKGEQLAFTHRYKYDKIKLNSSIMEHVWASMANNFYDKNMHEQDWNKLYNRFFPYTENLLSVSMLSSVIDEMIGELNASHTGYYGRHESLSNTKQSSYIGATFDYSNRLKKGLRIKKVYKDSQLAETWSIVSGDILLAIDGVEINEKTAVDELLYHKAGEKVSLLFKSKGLTEIKALNYSSQNNLRYNNWVAERAEIVNKATGGKIGYLHIRSMNKQSLDKFKDDLLAKNFYTNGLIIDVRKNGGGNISDDLVEILTRKHHSYTQSRYSDEEPISFPTGTYEKPLVLLIDEDSFSDAEVFPNLFKYLKLGTIIGMPTSGSVIGTGSVNFMDGSSMRMPSSGWYTIDKDGLRNMEGNPAEPDIFVPMTIEDIITDNDKQLQKAIEVLGF